MEQQEKLLNRLQTKLPINLLLIGPKYSGKKTLIKELVDESFCWVDNNVEAIRQLDGENFIFADIDDWSPACFTAMLKLLEENTHHIILTCKNILNVSNAIKSRCTIEFMEPYKNIGNYCDNIGQLGFYSDEMLNYIDKFEYNDKFDFDVYFSVLCNRLLYRIKNGEDLTREYLISCKYNAIKTTKSLNKKQFIVNWNLDLEGITDGWKRL